ncbi:serine/threonine-protein kinase PAK 3-like [Sitodiplosis mosellana]|uniref:serine/threonine-protein kinase PAK 3-like n=1 Tax=Sitodiplosis mosellana TaxID=263140 RepID=UPI0024442389|nr:serine/threonine-protein kinase PAK 3-like [Sitodiplosis mosellana]
MNRVIVESVMPVRLVHGHDKKKSLIICVRQIDTVEFYSRLNEHANGLADFVGPLKDGDQYAYKYKYHRFWSRGVVKFTKPGGVKVISSLDKSDIRDFNRETMDIRKITDRALLDYPAREIKFMFYGTLKFRFHERFKRLYNEICHEKEITAMLALVEDKYNAGKECYVGDFFYKFGEKWHSFRELLIQRRVTYPTRVSSALNQLLFEKRAQFLSQKNRIDISLLASIVTVIEERDVPAVETKKPTSIATVIEKGAVDSASTASVITNRAVSALPAVETKTPTSVATVIERSDVCSSSQQQAVEKQLQIHHIIENRFECHEIIGEGTFGLVYKGIDRASRLPIAVKIIKNVRFGDTTTGNSELQMIRKLDHGNIVSDWHAGGRCAESSMYIVFEYLPQTLHDEIQSTNYTYTLDRTAKVMSMVLNGLKHIHERNIIHRDVKPSNIRVDGKDRLKICDLGSAVELTLPSQYEFDVRGTYPYMAPEIFLRIGYQYPVDIWSTGCVLAEMYLRDILVERVSGDIENKKRGQLKEIFKIFGTPNAEIW